MTVWMGSASTSQEESRSAASRSSFNCSLLRQGMEGVAGRQPSGQERGCSAVNGAWRHVELAHTRKRRLPVTRTTAPQPRT